MVVLRRPVEPAAIIGNWKSTTSEGGLDRQSALRRRIDPKKGAQPKPGPNLQPEAPLRTYPTRRLSVTEKTPGTPLARMLAIS